MSRNQIIMDRKKLDQCSVIKRMILQHVMVERPDYAQLVEEIGSHQWVIMHNLPDCEDVTDGKSMCEIVHCHGEYAVVRACYIDSEPYTPGREQYVIHLSRWSEFFVDFDHDFFGFANMLGGRPDTSTLLDKES